MIRGFVGRPGAGKTYLLTHLGSREVMRGRRVFANYEMRGTEFFTPDQLLDLPPGLVILDEAHLVFGARNAMRLPPSLLMQMSQTRKAGWELWWSTQHERRVDSVIKDVTNVMTVVRPWLSNGDHPRFFQLVDYEPEFMRQKGKDLWKTWVKFDPKIAALYDTHERLQIAEHMRSKSDIYDKGAQ